MKAGTEMSFSAALSGLQGEAMSRERGRKKGEDRNWVWCWKSLSPLPPSVHWSFQLNLSTRVECLHLAVELSPSQGIIYFRAVLLWGIKIIHRTSLKHYIAQGLRLVANWERRTELSSLYCLGFGPLDSLFTPWKHVYLCMKCVCKGRNVCTGEGGGCVLQPLQTWTNGVLQ